MFVINGCDLEAKDNQGKSVLKVVYDLEYEEMIKLVLLKGAIPNIKFVNLDKAWARLNSLIKKV